MTKKRAFTLVAAILIILALGLGAYYYFVIRQSAAGTPEQNGSGNPFPNSPIRPSTPGGNESQSSITPTEEGTGSAAPLAQLRQISREPVAGAYIFDKSIQIGTSTKDKVIKTFIRFVEKGTGHISEASIDSSDITKITNTTIPKIYEAIWGGERSVIYRYLKEDDTIVTYSATIPVSTSTDPGTLDGTFLTDNISDIHFSPTGDKIFYLIGGNGVVAKPNGQESSVLYSSPLSQWLSDWSYPGAITLTTKPSGGIAGYAYMVNAKTGSATKVLGNLAGLTTNTSPSGATILYTKSNTGIETNLYSVKKAASAVLSINTLVDKCTWNASGTIAYCAVPHTIPGGTYPDAWYQGRIHFSDSIWKVNASTSQATLVYDPETSNRASIDAINLMVNPKENTLIFTNKNDWSLWSLSLQ